MGYKLEGGWCEYRDRGEKVSEEYVCVRVESGWYERVCGGSEEEGFGKVVIEDD